MDELVILIKKFRELLEKEYFELQKDMRSMDYNTLTIDEISNLIRDYNYKNNELQRVLKLVEKQAYLFTDVLYSAIKELNEEEYNVLH